MDRPTSNGRRIRGWRRSAIATVATLAAAGSVAACADDADPSSRSTVATETSVPAETSVAGDHPTEHTMRPDDRAEAQLAAAAFQDVEAAEAAGYASTIDSLGCFEDPALGGMGLHYLDESLMDETVDIAHPEALVYELDGQGEVAGLVAHEYIVPVEAWTSTSPPELAGQELHRHPTLPLWVLHTWIWKDNVDGVYADWNPAVRLCPPGVPVFGVDLPE